MNRPLLTLIAILCVAFGAYQIGRLDAAPTLKVVHDTVQPLPPRIIKGPFTLNACETLVGSHVFVRPGCGAKP